MDFEILSEIVAVQTIAKGRGIRELARLRKLYGKGSRKFSDGTRFMAHPKRRLFICLDNSGYEVSLERRKIYVALEDSRAERLGQLRIVDESGEDYLYPMERFVAAKLPLATRRAILQAV